MPAIEKKFNALAFIISYEDGGLVDAEIIEGFQHLIDSGVVWSLQGSYGRMAQHLIDEGLCSADSQN